MIDPNNTFAAEYKMHYTTVPVLFSIKDGIRGCNRIYSFTGGMIMNRSIRKTLTYTQLACVFLFTAVFLLSAVHYAQAAKLNKKTLELMEGSEETLILKKAEDEVTWKSGNRAIAKVDRDGTVKGVKKGTCTITASSAGVKYKCRVTVRSMGNVNTAGAMRGIDVSVYQGTIDFKKVKNDGIRFVIMRVGHGYEADTMFERNYEEARKNNLLVGCYWFITSTSKKALKKQANLCLDAIEGKTFDLPVFVDIESFSQFNKGKSFCSTQVDTFCRMVKKAGYTPGWYTSRSFVRPYLSDKVAHGSGYVTWVAEHNNSLNYDRTSDFWQYSHTGRVKGISTYVDLDWYFPNAKDED